MNDAEVTKIIAILHAHAPHHEITEETFTLWAWALEDIPFDAAKFAIRNWVKHHKHFPYPTEIREAIIGALLALPDADAAWAMVQARIKATYPGFPAPPWNAPEEVIATVQDIGGIYNLRMSERPERDRERFRSVYTEARAEAMKSVDVTALWQQIVMQQSLPAERPATVRELPRKAVS